jgi:L-2,4-diaminobutyrate transaminase
MILAEGPGHGRGLHRRADPRHRRHRAAAAGYWQKIQAVLDKYDILLVADEVVTGFGRLGTMFGSDHYGMKPDLITIAKGLTSAYAPLSGTIVSR